MPKENTFTFDSLILSTERLLRETAQFPGIQNYVPHSSQQQFHQSLAKEKLYIGGNRSGKTVAAVAEACMWLSGEHPYRNDIPNPPIRGRCVAVDIEDGIKKIALPEFQRWIPRKLLKNGSWDDSYDKQSRTLTLTNGSFIEFMSYEQEMEKFAGTSRHFVMFDEEPPEEIYNECLMRLVDTDGSYWISMTPLIELTWVENRIFAPWQKGDESIFVLEVNTSENPHVKSEAVDRLTRGLDEDEKATRKTGKFLTRTGLIYGEAFSPRYYDANGNVIPDILGANFKRFTQGWGHFVCMDHGLVNPTVFLFCCFNETGKIVVYDELYISGKEDRLVRDNAKKYKERVERLEVHPLYCVGDPSISRRDPVNGTSVQSEYAEHGIGVALGNNDVSAGIARIQNRFKSRNLFISERCTWTLAEISKYRWDRYATSKLANRRNKKELPLKKDDHCMDALRYGVVSRPALEGEVELPVGNFMNAPEAGEHDFDYALLDTFKPTHDEQLGIVW